MKNKNRGFTLAEVIMVIMIMGVIMSSLRGLIGNVYKEWDLMRKELAIYMGVNHVLQTMRDDIRRIPAPLLPSTSYRGTMDPIEVDANGPALWPRNFVYKGWIATDKTSEGIEYLKEINLVFRSNQRESSSDTNTMAIIWYRYTPAKPGVTSPSDYQLTRQIGFLPDTVATTSQLSQINWVKREIMLDNVMKQSGNAAGEYESGFEILYFYHLNSPSGIASKWINVWDFYEPPFEISKAEMQGRLPVAVNIKMSAVHSDHKEDELPEKHHTCSLETSVSIPVWYYE